MDSVIELWSLIKEYCKNHASETVYNLWIEPLEIGSLNNDSAIVYTDEFRKNIVESKFLPLIKEAFNHVLGFDVDVVIEVKTDHTSNIEIAKKTPKSSLGGNQNTFETFVVGSSNKFAHAAAQAVAANPGGTYNPLFIYGNSGLGKTHLLNAICYEIRESNPNASILYTSGEDFTNDLITYLAEKNMAEFHNKYRTADVLLMDDVQFIAGKIQTQEEFFHTFDTLHNAGKQVVLTSDRPPKEILTLEERLRTRFEWGLLADIQPPDLETRMAIIKRKAKAIDIDLSDEVIEFIAKNLKSNIRQLEGAVKKLKAYTLIDGHSPSIAMAQRAIKDILSDIQPVPITVEKILSEVGRTFGTTPEDIKSKKSDSNTAKARQVAMYVMREVIPGISMKDIGKEFGGKDHTTVLYSINKIKESMQRDIALKSSVQDIINNIKDR